MKQISATNLQRRLTRGEDIQIVDVRDTYEREIACLDSCHIPLAQLLSRMDQIPRDKMVIVHCRSGKRSAAAISTLERLGQFDNLYNLQGGILSWIETVDPTMEMY